MSAATNQSSSILVRRWADAKTTSNHTGIPVATLSTWRCTDPSRIPFHRIGRKVLYDLNEVDEVLSGSGS
jgi:hypothetical protein